MIDKWNEWRTGTGGVILFYSYLVAIIIAGVFIGLGVWKFYELVNSNHRALCSLKSGYQEQLKSTKKYLKEHPNGVPALGFSRADIVVQRDSLQHRIDDLSDIDCK